MVGDKNKLPFHSATLVFGRCHRLEGKGIMLYALNRSRHPMGINRRATAGSNETSIVICDSIEIDDDDDDDNN